MGFCHRCGEITSGKCNRCGGRSVQSSINTISENKDRWQSRYADTILLSTEEIKRQRIPVTQSSFYHPPAKKTVVCTICSQPTGNSYVQEESLTYCKPCHVALCQTKGTCPTCSKNVIENDVFIKHNNEYWHANCFTCFGCHIPLESNPLVDLQSRPCCESCFMSQAGSYEKKALVKNNSAKQRPAISQETFQEEMIVIPPRTPSPKVNTLSQRSCFYCHHPLGKEKKTKVPLDQGYAWFHKQCFLCSQCHQPFQGECATNGTSFYHPSCSTKSCSQCKKSIQTDAFAFNGQAYHIQCFVCAGQGCHLAMGQPIFELNKKPYCQPCYDHCSQPTRRSLGVKKKCAHCQESISVMEDTPGPLATRWHKKCLRCHGCQKPMDSAAKIRTLGNLTVVVCNSC